MKTRRRAHGPEPYELLAVVNAVVVVALIRFVGRFDIHPLFRLLESAFSLPFIAGWALVGLAARAVLVALGRRRKARLRAFLRFWRRPRNLLAVGRLSVATALVIYGYGWLKVFVPLLNRRHFDAALNRVDTLVHFGINPGVFLVELLRGKSLRAFLDVEYGLFVSIIFVGFGWFASALSRRERSSFALRYGALWISGAWLYLAVPAVGPCYVYPADYATVRAEMPNSDGMQHVLMDQYRKVSALRTHPQPMELTPVFGVAAFPSLHVGAQTFFWIWSRRHGCRALAVFFLAAALLTFFGSVLSGWHYAIDGYAGALLGWFWASARLPRRAAAQSAP